MPIQGIFFVLAAIVGAVSATESQDKQNAALKEAQEEARKLAEIRRQDDLKLAADNKVLNEKYLKLKKEGFAFEKREARLGRAERAEERGYARRERTFDKQFSILNRNDAMRNNLVNIWRRR